jgi:zinc transporter ZupT
LTTLQYIILFFSVILSGSIIFLIGSRNRRNLKLILSFSGSYLFAISVLHLIPQVYSSADKSIGIFIIIGFFFQILLEFFSEGIEHGHIHVHKHEHQHSAFPTAVILSLCVHSFLEGMPLADQSETSKRLLTGIVLHNIPVAFALMAMLTDSGIKKSISIFLLILFASMAPLGALLSSGLSSNQDLFQLTAYHDKIMAIVIGIFLHISTTILFESSENHRFNLIKFATILAGAGLAISI